MTSSTPRRAPSSSGGVGGLRVRDVASEAGLSPGLISYYYRSLDDLVVDVHADAVHRFDSARRDAIEQVDDPAGPAQRAGAPGCARQ